MTTAGPSSISTTTFSDTQARASAAVETFANLVLAAPWGSVSKSELDLLIFTLLMDSGKFGVGASDFSVADQLRTTPARVRTLRFRYEQRTVRNDPAKLGLMMVPANFSFGKPGGDGYFDVSIHRTYLREYVASRLMARRSVIYERTPAVLTINREELVQIVVEAVGGTDWSYTEQGARAYEDLFIELTASKDKAAVDEAVNGLLAAVPRVWGVVGSFLPGHEDLRSLFAHIFNLH